MDSISKGVKNNGEYDMWLTLYIKYFKMWKCHQSSHQNVEEAVSAANIKEMRKITNTKKGIYWINFITGWIFSYIRARGSLGKNVMTNLVGTKPYSDQLSVWGHFTASTNQIRTPLLGTNLMAFLLSTGFFWPTYVENDNTEDDQIKTSKGLLETSV